MSGLSFSIVGARPQPYAVVPQLAFQLRIRCDDAEQIDAMALRIQLQIEPRRRHYTDEQERSLFELFGSPEQWGVTLKTLHWAQLSVMVPSFSGSTEIDVPVPCTYDFDVASSKYFHALEDGEIPVTMLFSGTIFKQSASGFGVALVPWDLEANYRLPAAVWRDTMNAHFPNSAWIRLRKDSFDQLYRFKTDRGLNSWEDALDALMDAARERQ